MYIVTVWTYRNLKRELYRSTKQEALQLQAELMKDRNNERSIIKEIKL